MDSEIRVIFSAGDNEIKLSVKEFSLVQSRYGFSIVGDCDISPTMDQQEVFSAAVSGNIFARPQFGRIRIYKKHKGFEIVGVV